MIDSDMVITPHCTNPFDVVDEEKIGSIYEDKGSRLAHRRSLIQAAQGWAGSVGWTEGYINTGFAVFSKKHRDIFQPIQGQYWTGWGSDDVHLGWKIHRLGFEIQELPYQWNHMTMFSEDWNNYANRIYSNIIHYAGVGIFDKQYQTRIENIKADIEHLYGVTYNA